MSGGRDAVGTETTPYGVKFPSFTIGSLDYASSWLKHDGTDESAALQAAIDAVWTQNGDHGGTLMVPAGKETIAQNIILRPGVSIVSTAIYTNLTEVSTESWGHRFRLPDTASAPLFRNDTSNGYERQLSTDTPQLTQRYSGVTLAGLTFLGSQNVANHTADCDLIRLTRAWCVSIIGCAGIGSRGFGLRLLDCNVITVVDCNFLRSGVFAYSLADSIFRGGQYGLGNGLSSTPFWITGTSQKNQFQSLFVFNNNTNGAGIGITTRSYAYPMVVASVARNVDSNPNSVLFSTLSVPNDNAHHWTTGTPVTVSSTGALPAGLSADKTYYAIVVNTGRISFATTPERAAAGSVVVITDVGGGTITVQVGENCNLYVNDLCTKNRFSGFRLDQAFGAQMIVGNAPANAFQDFVVQEGAYGNYVGYSIPGEAGARVAPTPQAAIIVRNTSTQTILGGAWSIDGTKTGTLDSATGEESRQKYGVSVDATSLSGTVIGNTVSSVNHTDANSESGAANWTPSYVNPNRLTIPAAQFAAFSSATLTTFGGGRRVGWSMGADTVDGFIGTEVQLPFGWESVNITIYWVATTGNSGNASWALQMASFVAGENTDAADPVTTSVASSAAAGTNILVATVLSAIDFAQFNGEQVYMRVKHAGSDSANTYADAVILSHVVFEKA